MLQNKGKNTPVETYGYLIAIEIEPGGTTPEQVSMHIAEGLTFLEGVGKAEVELLGKLDVYDEDNVKA